MAAAAAGRPRPAVPGQVRAVAARRVDLFQHEPEGFSMHRILIVTPNRSRLAEFAQTLIENQDFQVAWVDCGQAAIADVMKHPPLGVIIDENLLDIPGIDLVRRILPINALINTVVISDLAPEAFHEASEGLGIMAQLPPNPTESDALLIMTRLKRMNLLTFAQTRRVEAGGAQKHDHLQRHGDNAHHPDMPE
jgi:DNA-binding NtrC family response regulator